MIFLKSIGGTMGWGHLPPIGGSAPFSPSLKEKIVQKSAIFSNCLGFPQKRILPPRYPHKEQTNERTNKQTIQQTNKQINKQTNTPTNKQKNTGKGIQKIMYPFAAKGTVNWLALFFQTLQVL